MAERLQSFTKVKGDMNMVIACRVFDSAHIL